LGPSQLVCMDDLNEMLN